VHLLSVTKQSAASYSKGKAETDLRPEQIQARIRVGLTRIREMLVEHSKLSAKSIVELIGYAG
jgi:hypothetical protein